MTTLNFAPLDRALNSLDRALARALAATEDEELRDACIRRFESSFELSWKMLKRQLREELANPMELDTCARFREIIEANRVPLQQTDRDNSGQYPATVQ